MAQTQKCRPNTFSLSEHIHVTNSRTKTRRISAPQTLRVLTVRTIQQGLPPPWLPTLLRNSFFILNLLEMTSRHVYSRVWLLHALSPLWDFSVLLHTVRDGHVGCFQFGATRSSTASNVPSLTYWLISIHISPRQTPRSGCLDHRKGIYADFVVTARVFQSCCSSWPSHLHSGSIPVALLPCQHLVLSISC